MQKGKKFLSDLKLYSDYFKWNEELERYENWNEACESIIDGHRRKYLGLDIEKYLNEAEKGIKEMLVLASQRNLQYRYPQIMRNNERMYNCFSGDTRVITQCGVKTFDELSKEPAGNEIKVWTHKGRWMNANLGYYGKQKLQRVTIAYGNNRQEIRVTPNHRWLLSDNTETTSLKVGDKLLKVNDIFNFDFDTASPFQKLYWCYGYVYGDGTKVKNDGKYTHSMVRLCGEQVKFASRFEEMGFSSSSSLSIDGDLIFYTGKYLKTLPSLNENNDLLQAFICGYLDADATKNKSKSKKAYDYIQCSDIEVIEFLRRALPLCGFFILKEDDLTGQETNFGVRPYTIKFSITNTFNGKNPNIEVVDIQEDVIDDVYCFMVDEDKSFTLSGGIVTGNCVGVLFDKNDYFQKCFHVLLSGCGLDFSIRRMFIDKLSPIYRRTLGTKTFVIDDSIEGWSDALGVLMSSYLGDNQPFPEYAGYEIKFDYSLIRPKGSYISGGFKAPGHEGLKQSLERIESLLEKWITNEGSVIRPILVYDIIMHAANAVLSGGVRRSACSVLIDEDDEEMIYAKIGNWRVENPQRARSNNAVGLIRREFSYDKLKEIIDLNQGDNDISFIFVFDEYEVSNPCREITFRPVLEDGRSGFQMCNLTEINASKCTTEQEFYRACRVGAILGTLQAGYTDFPYLGRDTEEIVRREALLGVSITGWMNQPYLFDAEILRTGAHIVVGTNKEVAAAIGINPAARTTTVKPSGNASVVLGTASGIHPEHSEQYFRIMQLNKESDTAKYLEENMPFLLEESVWSATNSDYVVFVPIVNPKTGLFKKDMKGVKHLELIKLVQENWVNAGTNVEACLKPWLRHSVSCTVIIDNQDEITKYIYDNQDSFKAVSFLSDYGDKDFNQAPFTSVLTMDEIVKEYGDGALLASGLIVDGLHVFDQNLWEACDLVLDTDKKIKITGTRQEVWLKGDWIKRAKKFAKNYFKGDLRKLVYCLKDIHLFHKWKTINRQMKDVDFQEILSMPTYKEVSEYSSMACSGQGSCEIVRI